MTPATAATLHDIDSLAGLRDELRLQAHLMKAELRDRWSEAEAHWNEIQDEAHALRAAVGHTRAELGAAASLTVDALRQSYGEIRRALRGH